MSDAKIELSKVISELRNELFKARKDGEGQLPRLVVDEAVIELQVGVTASADVKGGVSFWVYTAEAGGNLERETVQRITLKLSPKGEGGAQYETSGKAPRPE